MNENYPHPAMPAGAEEGIVKGMYLLQTGGKGKGPRVQLMGSGTILREVIAAADLLKNDFKVDADIWSVTSFNELRRDGMSTERFNLLHPTKARRRSYVEMIATSTRERGEAKTGRLPARRVIEIQPAPTLAKPEWIRVRLSDSLCREARPRGGYAYRRT
jgi:hypothetical protein